MFVVGLTDPLTDHSNEKKKPKKQKTTLFVFSLPGRFSLFTKTNNTCLKESNIQPQEVGVKGSHGYNIVVNTTDIKRTSDRIDVVSKWGGVGC